MDSYAYTAKIYITLFVMLSISATTLAAAAEYTGCPQYACNFIFGAIVTVYVIENWALMDELQHKQTPSNPSDDKKISIIKELTITNAILVKRLEKLKDELEKAKGVEKKLKKLTNFGSTHW